MKLKPNYSDVVLFRFSHTHKCLCFLTCK